jgi:hypothetical protein
MNWDNIDWKTFSCVDMSRKIKDEIEAKCPSVDALYEYLVKTREQTHAKLEEERKIYNAKKTDY